MGLKGFFSSRTKMQFYFQPVHIRSNLVCQQGWRESIVDEPSNFYLHREFILKYLLNMYNCLIANPIIKRAIDSTTSSVSINSNPNSLSLFASSTLPKGDWNLIPHHPHPLLQRGWNLILLPLTRRSYGSKGVRLKPLCSKIILCVRVK